MARCEICGKQQMSGNNVPHSVHKTRRKFNPNIQKVRIAQDGRVRRVYICARCLRTRNKSAGA